MRGKVLKIRPGYNPNSSAGGLALGCLLVVGITGLSNLIASIVVASILYKKRKRELEKSEYEKKGGTS